MKFWEPEIKGYDHLIGLIFPYTHMKVLVIPQVWQSRAWTPLKQCLVTWVEVKNTSCYLKHVHLRHMIPRTFILVVGCNSGMLVYALAEPKLNPNYIYLGIICLQSFTYVMKVVLSELMIKGKTHWILVTKDKACWPSSILKITNPIILDISLTYSYTCHPLGLILHVILTTCICKCNAKSENTDIYTICIILH